MIARIAYFENLTEAQVAAQADNYERRFRAALAAQPGLVAVYQILREDGTRVSVSIWESAEAASTGGQRANAVPLLEGQVGSDIPGPTRVEMLQVTNVLQPGSGA